MANLDDLVASHLEERLLDPERLAEVLSVVLDRREERAERRAAHATELRKRAAKANARLKRLHDAIESGVADLADESLKEPDKPSAPTAFAASPRPRRRMRGPEGGYRRDHLRSLAQRVEVAEGEVRIMGSRTELLRTSAAASGVRSAGSVRTSVPKWRAMLEEDEHYVYAIAL